MYAIEAIKSTTDSIMLLNLLGKIMMKSGDSYAALKCFEKAQDLSPMNIGRLCEIAEAQSDVGNQNAANDSIEQAAAQDKDSNAVANTSAKLDLNRGNTEGAKAIMAKMDSISEIISYMNNKAVALAKTNKFNDSVDLYHRTFESIPDDKSQLKAIVKYNLGLAMIRQNQLPEALKAMTESLEVGESRVKEKVTKIKDKIQKALDSGIELKIQSETPQLGAEEIGSPESGSLINESHIPLIGHISKSAGSYGLYKIFHAPSESELVKTMLAKEPPRFFQERPFNVRLQLIHWTQLVSI